MTDEIIKVLHALATIVLLLLAAQLKEAVIAQLKGGADASACIRRDR